MEDFSKIDFGKTTPESTAKNLMDQVARMEIQLLRQEMKRAINELCLDCGTYQLEHRGACEGCHFYDVKRDRLLWEGGKI